MNVGELLLERPKLQRDSLGHPAYWAIGEDVAAFLDRELDRGLRTLETGAGVSTIIFAIKGTQHTCVVPDAALVGRITEFCGAEGIALDSVEFQIGRSQDILPRLAPSDLDLVLIDGGHAFPIPFIDWFYAARAGLRDGGTLIVDDTQLWTGHLLVDFLRSEPNWVLECDLGKSAVLRKRGDAFLGDWTAQLFVIYDGDMETAMRMRDAVPKLRHQIPNGSAFVAVDEAQLMLHSLGMFDQRRPLPFPARGGKPADDETAVLELEHLRVSGAGFLVVFWPAFWWLEHYATFAKHLRANYVQVLDDPSMLVFDLRSPAGAG